MTQDSALATWRSIVQTPDIVQYFRGVFRKVAFTVAETGEKFTATHEGDRITLAEGHDPAADFVVPLRQENIDRLRAETAQGRISTAESFRIAQVLFTPFTQETLKSPLLSGGLLRRLAGIEEVIHVHLLNPDGGDAATHTLTHSGGQWQVRAGLHGKAGRTYRLTPDQALDYQRQVFTAMEENSLLGWWRFAQWYRAWRKGVSVTV